MWWFLIKPPGSGGSDLYQDCGFYSRVGFIDFGMNIYAVDGSLYSRADSDRGNTIRVILLEGGGKDFFSFSTPQNVLEDRQAVCTHVPNLHTTWASKYF